MKNISSDIRQVIFDTKMDLLGKAARDLGGTEKVRIGCSQVIHDDVTEMLNDLRASVQIQTP